MSWNSCFLCLLHDNLRLSYKLLDNSVDKRSWNEKLGKCDFTLGCILLLDIQCSCEDQSLLSVRCLPDPASFSNSMRDFTSWIIWGRTGEENPSFFSHSTEIALILLRHGQYDAVEVIFVLCCFFDDSTFFFCIEFLAIHILQEVCYNIFVFIF